MQTTMKLDKIYEASIKQQIKRAMILGEKKYMKATFILVFCLEALPTSEHREVESKWEEKSRSVDDTEVKFGSAEAARI